MEAPDCAAVDNTFGPHAAGCRGDFDFTLLFEETILSLAPLVLLLLLAPPRIIRLFKSDKKVVRSYLLPLKLVREFLLGADSILVLCFFSLNVAAVLLTSFLPRSLWRLSQLFS